MEVTVRVERILPPESFTKKDGTPITRNSFIGKTVNGQFDHQIKFDVINLNVWQQSNLKVGNIYTVSYEIDSRCWNSPTKGEQWFTSVNCWRCSLQGVSNAPQSSPTPQTVQSTPQPQPTQGNDSGNDLPF